MRTAAGAAPARTRPLYWSVRRELWENRYLHLAPLGVAAFLVVGLVIHGVTMPSHLPGMLASDPAAPDSASVTYAFTAMLMLATAFSVAALYSLDALSGERRDRSILFWKSLPVSDLTVVLAKAIVPLAIVPLVAWAVLVAMQAAMLLLSAAVLLAQGHGPAAPWREVQPLRAWPAMAYALAAMALWHAPVHAFLLLVSGWARRTAALWAVLPLLALGALEKLTLDTARVAAFVTYRLLGWFVEAFAVPARQGFPFDPLAAPAPARFLGSPGLWLGLAFAALCLAAAVRLRRRRDPA